MMRKIKKLAAYFGIYRDEISIHDLRFDGVKNSKALQKFYLNENFEIEMFLLLKHLSYETFIDAGAYFGYFSLFAKKVANISNVVAYEADPDNFKQLNHYIRKNEASVVTFNVAVGDHNGSIEFYKPMYSGTTNFPAHGQVGNPSDEPDNLYAGKNYKKLEVNMLSLSHIVESNCHGRCLLKIDIEGYEEQALRSIEKILRASNDIDLIVEIMINDYNKNELFEFITECGFNAYLLTNAGLVSESRPLTLPKPHANPTASKLRTQWKNHFFSKRSDAEIQQLNIEAFKYNL